MAKTSKSFEFENRTTYGSLQERVRCPLCAYRPTQEYLFTASELFDHLENIHKGKK